MINSHKLFEFDKEQRINSCHPERSEGSKKILHSQGVQNDVVIIGTDEAGRGPGAGNVFSAAVYFPKVDNDLIESLASLNDSKKLSEKTREDLYEIIINNSVWAVVQGSVDRIEKTDILATSLWAMKIACERVIEKARIENPFVLVDGNKPIRDFKYNQKWVKKGDSLSASIAAASIIAKVTRDRYMGELDKEYPQYDWKNNKGYMTKAHLDAVDKYGLTKYHRKSFFKNHLQKQMALPL